MVKQTQIQNIIFDLGAVLIDWNPAFVYSRYFSSEAEIEQFYKDTQIKVINHDFDRGVEMKPTLDKMAQEFPQYAAAIHAWRTQWPNMLGQAIEGTLDIAERLEQAGLGLYALTNWSHETFPIARERFSFLNMFRDIVVSGEVKRIKPEPEIYRILLEKNHLKPESCLFIDDVQANIDGAEKCGIKGVLFKSPALLEQSLKNLGLLPVGN